MSEKRAMELKKAIIDWLLITKTHGSAQMLVENTSDHTFTMQMEIS